MEKEKKLSKEAYDKLMKNELRLDIQKEEGVDPEANEADIEPITIEGVDNTPADVETKDGFEITEDVEVKIKPKKNLNYAGRGFKTLEDAINFPNTKTFKALGDADKKEYLKWLMK